MRTLALVIAIVFGLSPCAVAGSAGFLVEKSTTKALAVRVDVAYDSALTSTKAAQEAPKIDPAPPKDEVKEHGAIVALTALLNSGHLPKPAYLAISRVIEFLKSRVKVEEPKEPVRKKKADSKL